MTNKIAILFLIFASTNCCAQKIEDLKVLNHFSVNEKSLFIEGYLAPIGKQISTNNQNMYSWFSGGRLHRTQGDYKDRLLNGVYTESYTNRQLAKKGEFRNGLQTGHWYTWSEDGILKTASHYKNGELNNYQISYDSSGIPAKRIHYCKGTKQGLEQNYKQGDWKTVGLYHDGESVPLKESFIKRTMHAIFKKHPKKD